MQRPESQIFGNEFEQPVYKQQTTNTTLNLVPNQNETIWSRLIWHQIYKAAKTSSSKIIWKKKSLVNLQRQQTS